MAYEDGTDRKRVRGKKTPGQKKLAKRAVDFEKTSRHSNPGEGLKLHKPGSLNVRNH